MTDRPDRWILTRHRIRDDALGVALIWAGFAGFVLLMVLGVAAIRGPIQVSGWEAGSQLPRWFAGGVGVYLLAVHAPLYIAHGFTRREIGRQLPVAALATVLVMAALMTLGYGIERLLYGIAGWPQELTQSHLFTSATDYPLIFLEFTLMFAVWAAAGALVGAAVYRNPAGGLIAVPIGLVMIGLAEAVLNPGFLEVVTAVFGFLGIDPAGVSLTAAVGVAIGTVAVAVPLIWLHLRDLPLRSQRA